MSDRGTQVEGRRAVRELLRAGKRQVRTVWISGDGLDELVELAHDANAEVQRVDASELARRARTDAPQGVVATADGLAPADLGTLLEDPDRVRGRTGRCHRSTEPRRGDPCSGDRGCDGDRAPAPPFGPDHSGRREGGRGRDRARAGRAGLEDPGRARSRRAGGCVDGRARGRLPARRSTSSPSPIARSCSCSAPRVPDCRV